MPFAVLDDQTGRNVILPARPKRIISLVPSLTALICYLGLEDELVGVTRFCTYPEGLKSRKKVVGGTKEVRYDRIRDLRPDLIICNKEENTPEMVRALEQFCPVHVSDISTIPDFLELLKHYEVLFGIPGKTQELAGEISRDSDREAVAHLPPVKVAYFIWRKPWMLAGGQTFINAMLQYGGFSNVAANTSRYPTFENDWPEQWDRPDWVLLSSEPYPFKEKHLAEIRELFPKARVLLVDGRWFSWYGPELPVFLKKIAGLRRKE